jgi:hypothetical protein
MIGDIGVVNGSEDIMPFMTEGIPPNYSVRKKGMKTSLTTGVVIEVNHQLNIPGDGPGLIGTENIILIRPIAPFKELKVSYEVAPADKATIMAYFASNEPLVTVTANGNVLTFVTKTFGQAGDSGSVVVNSAGKVIGLFFAVSVYKFKAIVDGKTDLVSVDTGRGFACHISPVLQQMDITIESGAIHSAGEPIDLDEALLERVEMAPDLKDALSIAEADIRSLPEGEELINVFKSLGGEVTQLVHHHRPVKVVWHRNKCPAFSTSLINVVRDHTQMVHKEINGISISTAARNIGAALKEHGGTELRQALDQYGDIIIQLLTSCNNYDDMLHFLKQRSWGVQWLTDN